ncbi:MAG: Molybdopterin molybdenumtransferase [Syntrophorhabdus sp. PtaU1.Bin050]|nr:MAG: Molybdopterin molybdenumtransferase [Syntrophorhabdus sp. PtaU1.Bin050]
MTTYEDAVRKIMENIPVMKKEEKPLLKCMGQVSAEDIYSDLDLPRSRISGPDGYAVRSADIRDASSENPVILRILATARAGRPSRRTVEAGTAIRIMTGSVIPDGADCVIRFEDTDEPVDKNGPNTSNPSQVKIYVAAGPGNNIQPIGSNVRKGALVVSKGTIIGPTQISALALIGKTKIEVIRRPIAAIIATGDELVNPGKPLGAGKIYNCNTSAIASFVTYYGGIPKILGVARDNEAKLISKIRKGMTADVIITSGGVSKGDYDLLRLVLGKIGNIVFARIKMGPGASVAFSLIKKSSTGKGTAVIPVFSLAGPPAGCLVNFETLMRPAFLKMRGLTTVAHPSIEATVLDSVPNKMAIPFVKFTNLEKKNGEYCVTLNLAEKLDMLASMAAANSLTIIPESSVVKAGDKIQVLPLDWYRDHSFF